MRSSILPRRFSSPGNYKAPLIIFLAGMLSLNLVMAWNVRSLVRKGYPDFTIFYGAAKMLRQGLAASLYDPQVQYQVQQRFAGGVSIRQGALPYNHPPFEALLFLPLAWLPYLPAYLAWDTINVFILLSLPWLLRDHIIVLRHTSALLWCLLCLACFPIFTALLQGQDVIVLLLLICLAFTALKRDRQFLAGCWLGLGLFRFHLIAPLVLMLLWQKRARALLGLGTVTLLLTAISVAVIGWRGLWQYPSYVWQVEKTMVRSAVVPSHMPNLRGFAAALSGGNFGPWVFFFLLLVSIGLVFWVADLWKEHGEAGFNLGFSAALLATVLVSYHAFAYDLSLLILPVFLLLDHWRLMKTKFDLRSAVLFGPALALFLTPLFVVLWFQEGQLSGFSVILLFWLWGISREMARMTSRPQVRSQPVSAG